VCSTLLAEELYFNFHFRWMFYQPELGLRETAVQHSLSQSGEPSGKTVCIEETVAEVGCQLCCSEARS